MQHAGSRWARWDLHVHTPASHVHWYAGGPDVWDRYLDDLEQSLPRDIEVLGINDYLTVDGYERLMVERANGRLPNIKLLLPVVELRLKRFSGKEHLRRLNYHVIFSDAVPVETIRTQFLGCLRSSYEMHGKKWSGPPLPGPFTKFAEIIRSVSPDPSDKSDFALAADNYNVEEDHILEVLNNSSEFTGNYVTALGKAEWDALRWDGSPAEKLDIVERADFLFTACGTEAQFRSGQQKLSDETGNNRLLHCSDAHYPSDSTEPNRIGHCMTWIKAEPCFDGLLLARHEYDGRVYVGTSSEQQQRVEANPTKYLQSVTVASPSLSTKSWFDGEELPLNPGLVAIIGNKGTGKSALTDAIALVSDANVEEHMSFLRAARFRHERLRLADKHRCEIVWRSGDVEQRSLGDHIDIHKPERVRYLPQSYFERLCSEIGQPAHDEFERQLKQVVFTWLPTDRRLETGTLDDLIRVTN